MRQDLNSTKSILSKLIDDETLSIDPFAANSWATPSTSNVVKAVGGTLSTSSLGGYSAQISSRYLKGNEGTGGSTETTYYFTFRATGTDPSGRIASTQEIGMSYAAPTLE